jgi:hypothetical protein
LRSHKLESMTNNRLYHIGFGRNDLGSPPPTIALLSGDPKRARFIARSHLQDLRLLSESRGLNTYVGSLPLFSCCEAMRQNNKDRKCLLDNEVKFYRLQRSDAHSWGTFHKFLPPNPQYSDALIEDKTLSLPQTFLAGTSSKYLRMPPLR